MFIAPALGSDDRQDRSEDRHFGESSALADGDTVTVALTRSTVPVERFLRASNDHTAHHSHIAAKITPKGPVVFTVSSSTLVANPVVFGAITGDQVVIVSGVTPEMDIVTDARGLSDGETVIVDPGN